MSAICPKCRGLNLRRRVRSGVRMAIASIMGHWPYQCDTCGLQFYMKKRYVNPKNPAKSPGKSRA